MSNFFKRFFDWGKSPSHKIDDPEDPRLLKIHTERLIERDITQLTGICEYSLQDGHISQDEAEKILAWLNAHGACLDTWPANVLYDRLRRMLRDRVLDSEEQRDLLSLIMNIGRPRNQQDLIVPSLPVTNPAPEVIFEDRTFCFTGVFDFGSRSDCMSTVTQRGGVAAKGVTKKLNYLVIGNIGSEVWKHTSFGLKILKAVSYRDNGVSIAIIDENHWVAHIN
jgi:NAD-dependent DNA ligase